VTPLPLEFEWGLMGGSLELDEGREGRLDAEMEGEIVGDGIEVADSSF